MSALDVSDRHGVGTIYDTIPQLVDTMRGVDSIEGWSVILGDHISFDNPKLGKKIAVFNMGTAFDCQNMDTEWCQVSDGKCYATKAEEYYPGAYLYRRRQGYLWDSLDPETFAHALLRVLDRKYATIEYLRLNESGDFRTNGDIVRVNEVARILKDEVGVETYTYTASSYLDWSLATHFTVNASNDSNPDADQRFAVVRDVDEIPEDGFVCPADCTECRACMAPGGGEEIYAHYH